MKALLLTENNEAVVTSVKPPQTSKFNTELNVKYVGVCKTDHDLTTSGNLKNLIPGHEIVCQHEEVCGYLYVNNEISCGECYYCKAQLKSHCQNLKELGVNENGGYAEKISVPSEFIFPFKFHNPMLGIFIEPLSCAIHGINRIGKLVADMRMPEINVLICGGGISGALNGFLLKNKISRKLYLHLYDVSTNVFQWNEYLNIDRVNIKDDKKYNLIAECSGSDSALKLAFNKVEKSGIVYIYGVQQKGVDIPIDANEIFRREISIISSFAGVNNATVKEAVKLISQHEDFFEKLLGRVIPLDNLPETLIEWNPLPGTRTVVDLEL